MPARSTAPTCLVTGGSGLLGSHIAEKLVGKGARVRALVRQGSARGFLEDLGAEIVTGDLTDQACCEKAVRGVDFVYHAAAKVGDWGPWSEFQSGCVDATANLALAAKKEGIKRFVHISSTSAYGHPREGGPAIEESAELGQNLWWAWDYYTRSKVECERLLWTLAKDGLPLTVIRPSWLYGERDRTTVARLVERFRGNGVPVIGRGENPLSAIYAGCVADAAILAAEHPRAVGEAYNITDQGPITQREYLNLWGGRVRDAACRKPEAISDHIRGGFLAGSGGKTDETGETAAHQPIRDVVDGPGTGLQHGKGAIAARLGAGIELSGEHREDRPVV